MGYSAVTRVCVEATIVGVPVGVQIAWLLCTNTGMPIDVTRMAAVGGSHWATTQGPLAIGGGGNAQPATVHGAPAVMMGMPITDTRGLGTVGWTMPP
jgi:hypothetical protein